MKRAFLAFGLSLIAAVSACTFSQDKAQPSKSDLNEQQSPAAVGETVSAIDDKYTMALHDTNNNYWFSNGGQGVYRYDGKRITRFTTKDGLCSDHVGDMQQHAPTGDIVIITSDGLCRFDGSAFTRLSVLDASKSQWKIQPDDLWFPAGQDTGAVFRYDGTVVHRLTFPTTKAGDAHYKEFPRDKFPNAKYSPYDVYSIFKDSKGDMWFATATLGACRYDGTTFAWFAKPAIELDNFGTRSIIQDKDGKYLFSSTPNRYTFDPSPPNPTQDATQIEGAGGREGHERSVEIKYHMEPGFGTAEDPFSVFMSAVKDKNGDLWLCTLGTGVFRYDGTTPGTTPKMTHYPVTHDGAPIWVHAISLDRQDNPWLATNEHGAYKFNGKTFERFAVLSSALRGAPAPEPPTHPDTQPKIKRTLGSDVGSVGCQLQDKAGNIWFSTPGNGAFRFDGTSFTNFTTKDGLSDNGVGQIIQDMAGNILIATGKGICQFDGKQGAFTKRAELGEHAVTCLLEDRDGNLWFGTFDKGVFRHNAKDGTLTNFLNNQQFNMRDRYQLILDMHQDRSGNIWFSSWNGGGVWRYDAPGKTFKEFLPAADYYQVKDGFSEDGRAGKQAPADAPYESRTKSIGDDMIFSIAEDKAGHVWFATRSHGACRYDPVKDEFTHFRHKEGFVSRGVYSILEDRNGAVWFTTEAAGVWRYDGKTGVFENFTTDDGLVNNSVFSVLEDKDGNLWFGTRGVGLSRYDGTSFTTFSE